MSDDVLIRVEHVGKKFCRDLKASLWYGVRDIASELVGRSGNPEVLRPKEFWALQDVSFELRRGECLGLVGRNGAGKTTLLKMLNGLIKPDRGRIEMRGRVGALIALGAGFNPILSGRENVYINGAILGLSKKEIDARFDDIVSFSELEEFIDTPVQAYSSGMRVRLGFAVASSMNPDVLLLDEVLAVGDVAFRVKCFDRIGKVLNDAAVIFVSHNEGQIQRICNRAVLLSGGRIIESGTPDKVLETYRLSQERKGIAGPEVRHPAVRDIAVSLREQEVPWRGDVEMDIDITMDEPMAIGELRVNFCRNGEIVAGGALDSSYGRETTLPLAVGPNHISLRLAPMNLKCGIYTVILAIFDGTRKRTIAHFVHFTEVTVTGPIGSASDHVIPLEASVSSAAP